MVMKSRKSNFELLRLLAVFMVTIHHFFAYGGFDWDTSAISPQRVWYNFCFLGNIGNYLFAMLTGYFLYKSYTIKISRLLKLEFEFIFYSLAIGLSFAYFNNASLTLGNLVTMMIPTLSGLNWYTQTYIAFYLIHPFINKSINNLSKKEFSILLLILTTFICILPMIFTYNLYSGNIIWFIYAYSIGAYLSKFKPFNNIKTRTILFAFTIDILLMITSSLVVINYNINKVLGFIDFDFLYGKYTITVLVASLTLFLLFERSFYDNKNINILSSTTLATYLIHEHPLMRDFLWFEIFKNNTLKDSLLLIPYSIFSVVFILLFCGSIDLIRKNTIEKLTTKLSNLFFSKIKISEDNIVQY